MSAMGCLSARFYLVFLEDFFDPLERFLDRRLRSHAAGRNVMESDVEGMLGAYLRPGRIVDVIERQDRSAEALLDIGRPVRILLQVGPPRVVLEELRHDRQPAAEAALQIL